jgi:hypothetical protein
MSVMTDGAGEELFNSPQIEKLQVFAALDRLLEPVEPDRRCEIQQRAWY